jgi:hypothetical protein
MRLLAILLLLVAAGVASANATVDTNTIAGMDPAEAKANALCLAEQEQPHHQQLDFCGAHCQCTCGGRLEPIIFLAGCPACTVALCGTKYPQQCAIKGVNVTTSCGI